MKKIIVVLSVMALSSFAQASLCKLEANVSGMSWKLGVGGTKMTGMGTISCMKDGKFQVKDIVKVDIEGGGFGLGYAKITNAKLFSTGVGIVQSSEALTGEFVFLRSELTLGPVSAGAGASVYFNAKKEGKKGAAIPFGITFSGKTGGLLANVLEVLEVTITPIEM